jgi:hypothetical protein
VAKQVSELARMGQILLQQPESSFFMGELGDWNFGAGDLFLI